MSSFEKHRFRIYTPIQHPLKHSLDDFAYTNPGLGTQVSTVQQAIDYLFAVLYPQSKPAVDTPADLPAVGNTLNDFRVVNDDGDGKAAAYRWEQREGELSPSWHKIYDMDWGMDSILQQMELKTQDLYVSKKGYDERDASGNVVTGLLAGAYIYGGASANSNLTLYANSGDGTGPSTGYIQLGDNSRPIADNTFDFGTTALRFKKIWANEYQAGTLNLQAGQITDSSGTVDFVDNDITTTGTISASAFNVPSIVIGGTLTLGSGSIVDSGGSIDFSSNDLVTTGNLSGQTLTLTKGGETFAFDPDVGGKASVTASNNQIDFNSLDFLNVGDLLGDNGVFGASVSGGDLQLSGNSLISTNSNGNIVLTPNGTGVVDIQKAMTTLGQTVTGVLAVTGQLNADNLRLDGNVLSATNTNGNIDILPNGVGVVNTVFILPTTDNTYDLGNTSKRWKDLYLEGSITDGTDAILMATLLSLSDILVGATTGHLLFYNGVSGKWEASHPDSEIDHGELNGLGDDDHTQYLLLAGRSGGQAIIGGTLAGNNLSLESTSNASKGVVYTKDNFIPFTNASYSGGWSGTDLGDSTHYFNDVYTKGEFFGLRVENVTSNFASSSQNAGRLGINTVTGLLIYDTGSAVLSVGAQHSETDTVWNGTDTTKTVTVSGVADARRAIWQLKDNTNNFEVVHGTITQTNATTVVIDVNYPLPAGTYRLIGIQ